MTSLKKVSGISAVILLLSLSLSCRKNERTVSMPEITTTPVTEILYLTASSGGTVTNDGGAQVVSRGVCWGTSSGPTVGNNRTADGIGNGQFASSVKELSSGTLYYLRAYTGNSAGIAYGNEISFTTHVTGVKFNPDLTYGTVVDSDGKSYNTVQIGIKVWMAENLKTTKFNDGTSIPLVSDYAYWTNSLTPAYCWFDNNQAFYENIYGAYYNWFAVATGKLCPVGWHVPSDNEWQLLVDYLGGSNTAGSKIKETGTNNWILSNKGASNASGFTALPAGLRSAIDGTFGGQGFYGGWWSTTEINPSPLSVAWCRWIHGDTTVIARNQIFKKDGFSVRCVEDKK